MWRAHLFDKLVDLAKLQFPYLKNGDHNTYLPGLYEEKVR